MLDLEPLQLPQWRQAYEWDRAEEIESFESYVARLSRPEWTHYAITEEGVFVGCLSLELIDPATCSIHIAKHLGGDRHALRRLLVDMGVLLFRSGFQKLIVEIRRGNPAAVRLAADCGMTPSGESEHYQYLTLTADQYQANPERWS